MARYSREALNAMSQDELKQVYRSVRKNLLRNVNKMEKEGATFDTNMRPDIPKKITAGSIAKLQKYNDPDYRYSHASIKDKISGKIENWKDYQKEKRREAGRKGARHRKDKKNKPNRVHYVSIVDGRVRWLYEGVMANLAPGSCSRHEAMATKQTWLSLKSDATTKGLLNELNDYLQNYSTRILEYLDVMYYESDREEVKIAFSGLADYFGAAMDSIYSAIDVETYQQNSGGWLVYFDDM